MDAFSWGMQKRAGIEKNIFKKYFFNYEYKYLQKYETSMFNYFDHFTAISEQDSKAIINHGSKEIVIVPNGVDFSSFYPKNCEKKYDVCFMGNLDYPPNIEAVLFANKYIFPGLLSKKHNCKILIAGANPPLKIKALHTTNIDVIENFIDISDSIAISKVMLSPMIVSIGLQNKIIQAMAMKVPNVVSRHANNAINAKHEHSIFVADNPEDYIKYIIMLLNEETIRNEIAENAFYFVKERHSWDIVNLLLEKTIKGNKNEIRPD
jgi:glycosyltransferase involved in cell wall biosynthesis